MPQSHKNSLAIPSPMLPAHFMRPWPRSPKLVTIFPLTVWWIRGRSSANTIYPLANTAEHGLVRTQESPAVHSRRAAPNSLARNSDFLCGFSAAGVLYRLGVNPKEHCHLTEKPSGVWRIRCMSPARGRVRESWFMHSTDFRTRSKSLGIGVRPVCFQGVTQALLWE